MKKRVNKFTKVLLLMVMIISDLLTPIKVLADEITEITPNKGDVGISNAVSNDGGNSTTVYAGSYETEGDVLVTKTVNKTDIAGRYKVEFNVKGKELTNQIEITKPIYLVVVFDTSGSMICDASNGSLAYSSKQYAEWGSSWYDTAPSPYTSADGVTVWCNNGNDGKNVLRSKWENAVNGATKFSAKLAELGDETYISLVTFANSASVATDFVHGTLNALDFRHPLGSTNLKHGLANAQAKLDTVTDENAQKYILVIGDGGPTVGGENGIDATTAAKNQADSIKKSGIKIFAIGYGIDNDTNAQNVLRYVSSNTTVTDIDNSGNKTTEYKDNGYYQSASSGNINVNLQLVFNDLGTPKKAGINAVITDGIGSNFTVVETEDEDITVSEDGTSVEINIGDILSGDGTTKTFYVDIDPNAQSDTGWHNVNSGFIMSYTDNDLDEDKDGIADTSTIIYGDNLNEKGEVINEKDPEVYWDYNFIVNYYRDEITNTDDTTHYLGSKTLDVTHGNIVTEGNLDLSYLLPSGYEFFSGNTEPIIVSVDKINNDVQVVNILYTIKKFDYVINYYYADLNNNYSINPDSTIIKNNINYGTVVNTSDYHLEEVKEGYTLDSDKTNSENDISYTITDNNVIIDIYYKRNKYNYIINYHFNNVIDTDFTKGENALFGNTIKAENNYLEDSKLNDKNTEDNTEYFINPSYPSNPNEIVVGTNSNENVINIYYVSTVVTEEDINKTVDTDKITSGDTKITYKVDYTSVVNNIKKGDTVKVVITDILPLQIEESKSNLNGGVYDASSKTITWTFENTMNEFTERYDASRNIIYTVVYKNAGNGDGSALTNRVIGQTTAGGKTTIGEGDSSTVEVEIPAEVIVHHYEKGTTNSVARDEKLIGQVGQTYTTNYQTDIFGYNVDMTNLPTNSKGVYTEDVIEVIYYYIKNDGTIEKSDVVKTSTDSDKVIDSINSRFGYTIDASTEVKEYVGKVTLKVVDTLPYEIDIDKSNIGNCTYNSENKTITCIKKYTITEEDYTTNNKGEKVFIIDETFTLDLAFTHVDSEIVTNNAKVEIILDDSKITKEDNDTEDVKVEKGKVIATYEDTEGNTLHTNVTNEGLVGNIYVTEEKVFFGYTLTETPENKDGIYTKEDITVNYIYTKNNGSIDNTDVVKTSTDTDKVIDSVNGIFGYTIDAYGEVKNYVGKATLKVVDVLPYEIDIEKSNIGSCTYDSISKTIVCTKEYTITEDDYITNNEGEKVFIIAETFTLELVFVGVDNEIVTNNAKVEIILDDSKITEKDEEPEDVKVSNGTVTATYKDKEGNILHADVTTTDLAGTSYTTETKEFYGYSLIEVPSNKEGKYLANQTITVNYVYSKNDGKIENPKVEKIGPNSVDSIDKEFNYTFKYSATINEYTGKVTLKVVDTLPFKAIITSKDNTCKYDGNLTIVCEKEYNITSSTTINEEFNVTLKYIGIEFDDINTSTILTNGVIAELIYGDKKVTNSDEKDTVVNTGNVVATYKDTEGNTLHTDVTTTNLAGTNYTTEEKTFFGYTLTEVPENKEGTYLANQTITVNYVYSKNDGIIENTDIVKTSTDTDKVIDCVNSIFGYIINAYAEVDNYVGKATLKVVDVLPYEIDIEKSNIGSCTYDSESKTITCTKEYTVTEDGYTTNTAGEKVFVIDETFTLDLVFTHVDSETVTNNAKVEIILDDSKITEEDNDAEDVKVEKGKVIATYKDILGNILHANVTTTDLAGISYTTETKEFYGYTLTEVPENKEGIYLANQTITVNYVYSKNVGTSEEELVKSGEAEIKDLNSEFKYTITYNTTITDYVGEATLVITDELPYEIDIEKSIYNNNNCEYKDGKLICTYKKNITKEDNIFNIEEKITLYYKNITESKVTNKAISKLTYGNTTKENNSEYTSEVKEGTVIVNYVNKEGYKLTDSIVLTGLVGDIYTTNKKIFDKYNFIEVKGEVEGKYKDGVIEVTYVYDLTPLPPQTGVEFNLFMFIKYLLFAAIIIVSGKTYKLIKNN